MCRLSDHCMYQIHFPGRNFRNEETQRCFHEGKCILRGKCSSRHPEGKSQPKNDGQIILNEMFKRNFDLHEVEFRRIRRFYNTFIYIIFQALLTAKLLAVAPCPSFQHQLVDLPDSTPINFGLLYDPLDKLFNNLGSLNSGLNSP